MLSALGVFFLGGDGGAKLKGRAEQAAARSGGLFSGALGESGHL